MPFEFGDVVLVPFPFTSQRESKKQPAVVVSNRAYSTARLDLLVMAVTSRLSAESRVWRRMGQLLAGRRVHGLRRDLTNDSDGQAWTDPPRAANGARSARGRPPLVYYNDLYGTRASVWISLQW
jgi:PemK-like, MazF-like toxin of type II toxin-antitoxin system